MNLLIETTLKDKTPIIIRPICEEDANARHLFFVELSNAQEGVIHTPDEISLHTHESEEKIADFLHNHRGLWLLAVHGDGEVIGEIDIEIKNLAKLRHVGALTIGVSPKYQGLGLGSLLMTQALAWAHEQKLSRIELCVFANNMRAQSLYKKHGFIAEGKRKNYLRHQDGRFEDDILMASLI